MAAGRVDLSGGSKSKPAPAKSSGGAMGKNDKVKLGIAIGALAIGGLVMSWYFGAFDSLLQPKIPDGTPTIGGTAVTAEQKAEYEQIQKINYEENEKAKEGGATSAGS